MRRLFTAALCAAIGLALTSAARAQQPANPGENTDDIRARLERQEWEIQQLRAQLTGMQAAPAITEASYAPPSASAAAKDPAKDAAKEPAKPYVVGSDLSAKLSFKDGLFPWIETPNKDFTMHLSGWLQEDTVYWQQSQALKAAPGARPTPAGQGVAYGDSLGGIGELEDGTYFRRVRASVEGAFWETGEYRIILALENNQFSTVGLDEVWVGEQKLPWLGTVRVGHVKNAIGLEGDMTTSSRAMTFMERSSYSEAIELNQNFVTGLFVGNNYLDQHVTSAFTAFRADQGGASGAFFGDGQYGLQARFTGLPLYEDEGRHLLHFGFSGGWRDGTNNLANGANAFNTFQLRARPEMRDDDPAASPSGGQALTNANSNRMVDTGVIISKNDFLAGLETLYIRGPFSFQAEYGWNWLNDATGFNPTAGGVVHAMAPYNYIFDGGYAQVAYTLTGESRGYDRRFGTLSREYFGKKGPYENAYLVRDEDGCICSGWGAWEVAARWDYVNLNSGGDGDRIRGGDMQGLTLGLNWYLNTNLNVMFDYVYDYRYNLPTTTAGAVTAANSTLPGHVDGFGARVQFQF